jgi:hypothetical protein
VAVSIAGIGVGVKIIEGIGDRAIVGGADVVQATIKVKRQVQITERIINASLEILWVDLRRFTPILGSLRKVYSH